MEKVSIYIYIVLLILNFASDGDVQSASYSGRFTPNNRIPSTTELGDGQDPQSFCMFGRRE